MKKLLLMLTGISVMIGVCLTGCGEAIQTAEDFNTKSNSDLVTEQEEKVQSIEEYGYVPVCYSSTTSSNYWMLINVSEKCILPETEQAFNVYQWNSSQEKPAYCFVRYENDGDITYRLNDYYTASGQFLGTSYEQSGPGMTSSGNGYAVIHTKPEDDGSFWSIVVSEEGDVVAEVFSNDYVICSWDNYGLSRIIKDGLYGYMDESGNIAIGCQFTIATDFTEDGYAAVGIQNGEDYTTYVIDEDGEEIREYAGMLPSSYGAGYLVCCSYNNSYVSYVIDADGNIVDEAEGYLGFIHAYDDGTVLYCKYSDDEGAYVVCDLASGSALLELEANTITCSEDGTIIVRNEVTDRTSDGTKRFLRYEYQVLNQNLEDIFDASEYTSVTPILDGNYFSVIWEEDDSRNYYIGIVDSDGSLVTYGYSGSGQSQGDANDTDSSVAAQDNEISYDADNFVEEYEIVYERESAYTARNSAWGTAMASVEALITGNTETCVSCFYENADGTLGESGMDAAAMKENIMDLGDDLSDEYGSYYVKLYITDYQDVSRGNVSTIQQQLDDTGCQVEAVCTLKGNYLLCGSEDYDNESDLEDNDFDVTVVCIDGNWYVWSF